MKLKSFNLIQPRIFLVLGFLIVLTGCMSIKPGGVKSGKNLFETFYVGEDGTQYFIKPLAFSHLDNKDEMNMDFTFRYKDEIKDSVIVNFSLQSETIYKSIDSFSLSNATDNLKSNAVQLLFNERRKKEFYSRFSTKFSLIEFNELFKNHDWKAVVSTSGVSHTYLPEKKSKKALAKLQDTIFIILQ